MIVVGFLPGKGTLRSTFLKFSEVVLSPILNAFEHKEVLSIAQIGFR